MIKPIFLLVTLTCVGFVSGQNQQDSTLHYSGKVVTVTHVQDVTQSQTPIIISAYDVDSLANTGAYNLADILSKIQGVELLSTGPGISKPAIRGLYGSRNVILLSGLKFNNQQWQDEHGMGLSDIGISRIELIKGALGVLYGSEAMGGVINIIEETPPNTNTSITDYNLQLHSNTFGGRLHAGYRTNNGDNWWRVRLGLESNADYSDGNNNRVLNSRFDGYYLKASYGFKRGKWLSANHFMSSFNRSGFIFNDVYTFIEPDYRLSRQLNNVPAHLVVLNNFSSVNKRRLSEKMMFHLNAGISSNKRMENEGAGAISLNMHLLTVQYLAKLEYFASDHHKLILSSLGNFKNNTNFGARKIVPNANSQEENIALFWEYSPKPSFILENGVSIGEKWLKTLPTPTVNVGNKEVTPFSTTRFYYNFVTGAKYNFNALFDIKFNLSTGIRLPNLAELSSDGLHEGVYTYEIGNPNLKNEQMFSGNLMFNFHKKFIRLNINPFYNYFNDFVFLSPTEEQWYGFPVYRYQQQNATQFGVESNLTLRLGNSFQFQLAYSGMRSYTSDGNEIPFTPPQKLSATLTWKRNWAKRNTFSAFFNSNYYAEQNNTAEFETTTPDYLLLNAGINTQINHKKNKSWNVGISVNNILNEAYYSHLSRFKTLGLLNQGRNITVNIRWMIKAHQ